MIARMVTGMAAAGLSVVAIAGCSQVASLQQVSGVPVTSLTIAANDVLVSQKVPVLEAPKCKLDGATYTCSGSTTTKQAIEVTAPDTENLVMTVKVGGKQIFSGSVQEVIERNQRGSAR